MSRKKQTQQKSAHGQRVAKPPELAIWKMLIQRCRNPKYAETKNFGVPICERWLGADGFANFLADLGSQPFKGAGLCRRDSCIGFEPANVEWADTRSQRMLTHAGRTMSIAAWAKETGINERTIRERLRRGWTDEEALSPHIADRWHLAWCGTRRMHWERNRQKRT